jgi:RNA polymerase sigma-70 factor (ECF subfamily)
MHERVKEREVEWATLMRAANGGDAAAYERLLRSLAPALRSAARRGFARAGMSDADAEDVVQETLLAIHLKRHTWDAAAPVGPWVYTIARNKLVDVLRRRGRRVVIQIEEFAEVLAAHEPEPESGVVRAVERRLGDLPPRQREVVRAIAVEGASIGETAGRIGIKPGAVRVALHRGLAALAVQLRKSEP